MRKLSFIFIVALVVVLGAGAGAVYLYDRSNEDTIAAGVTVAGVEVGGLSADDARGRVRRQVAAPLREPIVVRRGGKRFKLSAQDARIRADVGGMVAEALRRSRRGSMLSRAARDISGGEEDIRVASRVSYSKRAARKLVKRVSKRVSRPARDAEVQFPSLERVSARKGFKVRRAALARAVDRALTSESNRTAKIPVEVVRPKVTRADLEQKYQNVLVLDRAAFKLRHYENLQLKKEYTVAVGQAAYPTPTGLFQIQNKTVDPVWNVPNSDWAGSLAGTVVPGGVPENPLKARWMGIDSGVGIHGTDDTGSLGTAASHGCIRMSIPEVTQLYEQIGVDTTIYIS